MNNLHTITEFLGWCSILNIALLLLTFIMILVAFKPITKIHIALFNSSLTETYLMQAYFDWMAKYKILIIIFNIIPYFALKIMGY